MTHTLVAAFDTLDDAMAAKSQLLSKQILESDIDISSSKLNSAQTATSQDAASSTDVSHTPASTSGHHGHDDSFGQKVSHFFSSLFGTDEDDKPHRYAVAYPEAYRRGATVLTVTVATDEQAEEVEDILERNGAIDIDERSSTWATEDATGTHAGGVAGATTHIAGTHLGADHAAVVDRTAGDSVTAGTAIPVIEEDVRVGKREVNTGRVRVVSRVTERPVEETVNLHEEHAHIERRPVNRPVAADELNAFKAGSIEIQETAEEVVVEKSARVVEEVVVGKQSSDRQETVHDTVRRTDVDIENDPVSPATRDPLLNTQNDRLKDR